MKAYWRCCSKYQEEVRMMFKNKIPPTLWLEESDHVLLDWRDTEHSVYYCLVFRE